MVKLLILLLAVSFIAPIITVSYAQEEARVIREAKEANRNLVAVEGYAMDDLFEVTVLARMKREKPRIHNAIVVGPGIGRLSCETKEVLVATTEELEPFMTKRKDKGFINFGKEEEEKSSEVVGKSNVRKGRITKAVYVFRIPREKLREDKKYKLWVQILSSQKGSKYKTYKFDLEDFAKYFAE